MKTETDPMTKVASKLDTLIRLVAMDVASRGHSLKDKAVLLQRAGLAPREIAALLGTTPNTVSVALSTAKRGRKRG